MTDDTCRIIVHDNGDVTYRGYKYEPEEDRHGIIRTKITAPNGDAWLSDGENDRDVLDEIDSLLEEKESLSETIAREAEWRRR